MIFFKLIMLALLWLTFSLADEKYGEPSTPEKHRAAGLAAAGEAELMSMREAEAPASTTGKNKPITHLQTFPSLVLPQVIPVNRE